MTEKTPYGTPPRPGDTADLSGSPMRRDYGPKGCAGIVLAPVVLVAALLRLRGDRRG